QAGRERNGEIVVDAVAEELGHGADRGGGPSDAQGGGGRQRREGGQEAESGGGGREGEGEGAGQALLPPELEAAPALAGEGGGRIAEGEDDGAHLDGLLGHEGDA